MPSPPWLITDYVGPSRDRVVLLLGGGSRRSLACGGRDTRLAPGLGVAVARPNAAAVPRCQVRERAASWIKALEGNTGHSSASDFHSFLPITCNGWPGAVGLMIDGAEAYLYARRAPPEYITCGDVSITSVGVFSRGWCEAGGDWTTVRPAYHWHTTSHRRGGLVTRRRRRVARGWSVAKQLIPRCCSRQPQGLHPRRWVGICSCQWAKTVR